MGPACRYLRNYADLYGRRLFLWQPGLARSGLGGVRSRVGDCVPHGGILRRVSVSWLPPVHLDYGHRVLAIGSPTFYCFWLRSSRQSRGKLDGRSDGRAVRVISLFYTATNGQLVVRVRSARQFCVRRNIHLLSPEQRVSLLRTPAQLYAPGSAMAEGRFSRPGGQRNDVCRTRPLVRAVQAVRPACIGTTRNKPSCPDVVGNGRPARPAGRGLDCITQ